METKTENKFSRPVQTVATTEIARRNEKKMLYIYAYFPGRDFDIGEPKIKFK